MVAEILLQDESKYSEGHVSSGQDADDEREVLPNS